MDVVIVTPPGLGGIYDDNRTWANQFAAADPNNRETPSRRVNFSRSPSSLRSSAS
jgi:hypothetical protein